MSEETKAKQLKKALGYEPKLVTKTMPEEEIRRADAYCEGYKTFMDAAKTEREAVSEAVKMAEKAGFVPFDRTAPLKAGDRVYVNNRNKALLLAVIGSRPIADGVSIAAADTFAEAQIPAIGVSCTNASVTDGHDWYFRICFLDPFQGSVMAQFAWDMVAGA